MGIVELFRRQKKNIIIGIIDSKGSSGSKSQGQKLWTFSFNFAYWYINDSDVNVQGLHVSKKVKHAQVETLMNMAKSETVIKITFRGDMSNGRVELDTICQYDYFDSKLQPFLDEVRKEITFKDEELGIFTLDKSVDSYSNELYWCDEKAELIMNTNEENELIGMISKYKSIFSNQLDWDSKAKSFAAKELINLKNDFWLADDEEEMDELDFVKYLSLESLVFYSDDSYTLWFKDGDIFGGHVIIVYGSIDAGFARAEMAG